MHLEKFHLDPNAQMKNADAFINLNAKNDAGEIA